MEDRMDSKQLIEQVAPNSVELTTNAKGRVQVSIKLYNQSATQAAIEALKVLEFCKQMLGDQMANG
jgi:hypothetical protein